MLIFKFCLILFLLNVNVFTFAADNDSIKPRRKHFISINSGLSSIVIKDDVMSPFIYRGHSIPINVEYQYFGIRNSQVVSVDFNQFELKSQIPDHLNNGLVHYIQGVSFDVRYSYLCKITKLSNFNTTIFIGANYNSFLNSRNHFFTEYNSYLMVDCFNSLSISTSFQKDFEDNRNFLYFNASIPVLSYVLMGQTYNAYVGEKIEALDLGENVLTQILRNGDFVSFNKLIFAQASINYVTTINKHINFSLKYAFQYYRFSKYDDLFHSKNLSNNILVGGIVKF